MKVLVLGHEGYLGRGLFDYFRRQGHTVIGWDKKEDIFNLTARFLHEKQIELVVNLSVMADRGSSIFLIDTPTERVNVFGARHLAEILRGTDIAWFQLSTREVLGPVYGPKDILRSNGSFRPKFFVDETYPYAPRNFYAKSKIVAEMMSESHPKSNVIRLTTCYTDYDFPGGGWMLQLLRSAVAKQPVQLTQGGAQFRDPMHVDDLGRLMEMLFEKKVFGEKIHAGGSRKNLISLKELVKIAEPKIKIKRAPGGDYGFAFDIRKAKRLTGWEPHILVRDKIGIICDNIRRGKMIPPSMR